MDLKKILVKENETNLTNEVYLNSYGKNESFKFENGSISKYINYQKHQINMSILRPEIIYSKYNFLE